VQQKEKKITCLLRKQNRKVLLFFGAEVLVSEEEEEKPEAEAVEGEGEEVWDFRTVTTEVFK